MYAVGRLPSQLSLRLPFCMHFVPQPSRKPQRAPSVSFIFRDLSFVTLVLFVLDLSSPVLTYQ